MRKVFMLQQKTEIPEQKNFMLGAVGIKPLQVPSADRQKFRYMTIDNGQTNNTLTLSVDGSTPLLIIGKYCCRTIPIPPEITDSFYVSWTDPDMPADKTKMFRVYFSLENLNYNACYQPGFV